MGYVPHGTSWRAPQGRKAIFVGDLIDRGPEQVRVVETVRSMVDDGQALCVLGNHEFNAIGWATRRLGTDGNPIPESVPDAWLKKHTARNLGNHAAFLAQVNEGSALHADMIRWFRTLPVALDLGGIRVAHAWWNDTLIRQLDDRLRWWLPKGSSWRAAAFVSDEARERLCDRTPVPDYDGFGEVEGAPVFIGHYWMDGPRTPQSSKVACCDYSVPRSRRMVAYRWDGEAELVAGKFVESS